MRYQNNSRSGGFTLIEVIVTITILAVLASLAWQATNMVKRRQMNKQAEIQIGQMEVGMNNYRQDYGDALPAGAGDEWSAHVLYKALYCDEDNDGEPDIDKKTKELKVPYCEAIKPVATTKHATELLNGIPATKILMRAPNSSKRVKKKYFAIIDPWGKPYRYRLGYEMRDEHKKEGKGVNPDFDIFSQGEDGEGNGLTNIGDNEDNISNIRSWN